MHTQVVIIGAGPSGLLLGQILHNKGIDCLILECRSSDYVLGRIRAGILEDSSRRVFNEAGVGARMEREGLVHDGVELAFNGESHRVNFKQLINSTVMVYGQTEITKDMMDAREKSGAQTIYEAQDVTIHDYDSDTPSVSYKKNGVTHHVKCAFIAGCDGFHGVSRATVKDKVSEYERVYPFGWLGLMVDQPPLADELIYSYSERGFALCSQRSSIRSRYYLQCSLNDHIDDWSDTRFYDELRRRIPEEAAANLQIGPSIEKSIAPLRSFVAEPMRFGRLFLAGDAAHIVPPTGAKGLNLAVSDVVYLSQAFIEYFEEQSQAGINDYSRKALARIWKAERFSWATTMLLHHFPDSSGFDRKMQKAEFEALIGSKAACQAFAENYTGLAF